MLRPRDAVARLAPRPETRERRDVTRLPAVPARAVDLRPIVRVARRGLARVERRAVVRLRAAVALRAVRLRAAATDRLRPDTRPALRAFFRAAGRRRATFALLPDPPFIPPPVSLLTVAQARATDVLSSTPRCS
ncbi:hypothetical protein KRR26_29010 [Corallococcus sp. M34]|uniref:hypothetical protein n=1 Tax=Citreicoccus inhibens TaxID=2849499 RepID=UPI001C216B16|nr:hypothetical protein [Citreicoccus inhibens]MBU8899658.1 hypothetical protein [Citreicoccus inhibens]